MNVLILGGRGGGGGGGGGGRDDPFVLKKNQLVFSVFL